MKLALKLTPSWEERKINNMKKYFNGKGTINGTQALIRGLVPTFLVQILANVLITPESGPQGLLFIPLIIGLIWLALSTAKKRLQAYGWTGGYLNMIFPNLTDASYPNGKQDEE